MTQWSKPTDKCKDGDKVCKINIWDFNKGENLVVAADVLFVWTHPSAVIMTAPVGPSTETHSGGNEAMCSSQWFIRFCHCAMYIKLDVVDKFIRSSVGCNKLMIAKILQSCRCLKGICSRNAIFSDWNIIRRAVCGSQLPRTSSFSFLFLKDDLSIPSLKQMENWQACVCSLECPVLASRPIGTVFCPPGSPSSHMSQKTMNSPFQGVIRGPGGCGKWPALNGAVIVSPLHHRGYSVITKPPLISACITSRQAGKSCFLPPRRCTEKIVTIGKPARWNTPGTWVT